MSGGKGDFQFKGVTGNSGIDGTPQFYEDSYMLEAYGNQNQETLKIISFTQSNQDLYVGVPVTISTLWNSPLVNSPQLQQRKETPSHPLC